jgi:carbon storage regulator CsrA
VLAITRRVGESVTIFLPDGRVIEVVVYETHSRKVRIGIEAPTDIDILRTELIERQPYE